MMGIVSLIDCDKAIYSASVVESATCVCSLLCHNIGHNIGHPEKLITKPDLDLAVLELTSDVLLCYFSTPV